MTSPTTKAPTTIPIIAPDSPVMSKNLSFKVREKSAVEPLHLPRSLVKSYSSDGRSPSSSANLSLGSPRRTPTKQLTSATRLKPNSDPATRFTGRWESNEVDGLAALTVELGVSSKFNRLSNQFGSLSSVLTIEQDGDLFSIEDSNDLREVLLVFVVGTPFESENEKGEEVVVGVSWEGPVLCCVSTPKTGSSVVCVRRWIEGDNLVQTSEIVGSNQVARRTFIRVG